MTNHPMRRECTVTNPTPITPTWQTVFDFLDKDLKLRRRQARKRGLARSFAQLILLSFNRRRDV